MLIREEEFHYIDKLPSIKIRPNLHTQIDEKNLQIHIKELTHQDLAENFHKTVQMAKIKTGLQEQVSCSHRLNHAMQEACQSYEAMVEFHYQIKHAYNSIVDINLREFKNRHFD